MISKAGETSFSKKINNIYDIPLIDYDIPLEKTK